MSEYLIGGLYSVRSGDRFKVAKVLAFDDDGVHIRLYKETFSARPKITEILTLTLGKMGDDEFGIGHLPVAQASFVRWEPAFIAQENVLPDELEGYELWKSGSGGFWT
jgi:hypothetical protein